MKTLSGLLTTVLIALIASAALMAIASVFANTKSHTGSFAIEKNVERLQRE